MFVYGFSRHWAELIWPIFGGGIKTGCYVTIGKFWRKKNWTFSDIERKFSYNHRKISVRLVKTAFSVSLGTVAAHFFRMTCVFIVFFRVGKEIFHPLFKMGWRGCLNCILKSMGAFRGKPTFTKKLFSWSFSDLTGNFLELCWIFLAWLSKLLTTSP